MHISNSWMPVGEHEKSLVFNFTWLIVRPFDDSTHIHSTLNARAHNTIEGRRMSSDSMEREWVLQTTTYSISEFANTQKHIAEMTSGGTTNKNDDDDAEEEREAAEGAEEVENIWTTTTAEKRVENKNVFCLPLRVSIRMQWPEQTTRFWYAESTATAIDILSLSCVDRCEMLRCCF